MNHQVDHGNLNHRFTALRQRLVVFTQPTISAQPAERSLHDPSLRQYDERAHIRSFHDLDHAAKRLFRPRHELAGIAAVRPDELEPSKTSAEPLDHQLPAIAILNAGGVNNDRQNQSHRIDDQMTLSAGDFLAGIVAMRPPFRGASVLMDCESMIAAEGVGFLPTLRRTFSRRAS
jgi:hypothetical protein